MVSDMESVRVTHGDYQTRKKHMLMAVGIVLILLVIGIAIWLMSSGNTALFPVRVNGKYGYINKSAQMTIQPQFDRAEPFTEGYAAVRIDSHWGYIDKSGKLVIAPQYDLADPFSDGVALVGSGAHLGYIDKNGKYVINPQFDGAGQFGG